MTIYVLNLYNLNRKLKFNETIKQKKIKTYLCNEIGSNLTSIRAHADNFARSITAWSDQIDRSKNTLDFIQFFR